MTEVEHERRVVAVTLDAVVPLALSARLVFFTTGHQETLEHPVEVRIFLTPTLSYPLPPMLAIPY
jgi:hypothetical protein